MDRKTLLAFGLIAVVLILTPWYMSLVSPPPLENKYVGALPSRSNLNENDANLEREGAPSSLSSFSEEPVSNQEQAQDQIDRLRAKVADLNRQVEINQ